MVHGVQVSIINGECLSNDILGESVVWKSYKIQKAKKKAEGKKPKSFLYM